jgi:hypothetical protein
MCRNLRIADYSILPADLRPQSFHLFLGSFSRGRFLRRPTLKLVVRSLKFMQGFVSELQLRL